MRLRRERGTLYADEARPVEAAGPPGGGGEGGVGKARPCGEFLEGNTLRRCTFGTKLRFVNGARYGIRDVTTSGVHLCHTSRTKFAAMTTFPPQILNFDFSPCTILSYTKKYPFLCDHSNASCVNALEIRHVIG